MNRTKSKGIPWCAQGRYRNMYCLQWSQEARRVEKLARQNGKDETRWEGARNDF